MHARDFIVFARSLSLSMFGGGGDKDDEGIRSRWSKCGFLSKLPLSQCVRASCGLLSAQARDLPRVCSAPLTPTPATVTLFPLRPQVLWRKVAEALLCGQGRLPDLLHDGLPHADLL